MRADVSSYWSSIVFYKTAVGMNSEGFFICFLGRESMLFHYG